jgi:hypothetical protein
MPAPKLRVVWQDEEATPSHKRGVDGASGVLGGRYGAAQGSPVVATGGNRSQIVSTRKRLKQAKTVAAVCDRLPQAAHSILVVREGDSGPA